MVLGGRASSFIVCKQGKGENFFLLSKVEGGLH